MLLLSLKIVPFMR